MDDIDRELSERYDYTRRRFQSDQRITIPVALLEEAMSASQPGGDAYSLLDRMLERGPRMTAGEVLGTATLEVHADASELRNLEARVVQLEAESAALQTGVKRYLRTLTFGD